MKKILLLTITLFLITGCALDNNDTPVNEGIIQGEIIAGINKNSTRNQLLEKIEQTSVLQAKPNSECLGITASGGTDEILDLLQQNEDNISCFKNAQNDISCHYDDAITSLSQAETLLTQKYLLDIKDSYTCRVTVLVPEGEEKKWIDILNEWEEVDKTDYSFALEPY